MDIYLGLQPLFNSYADSCVPAWVVTAVYNANFPHYGPPYTYAQICNGLQHCSLPCPDTCGAIGNTPCDSILAVYNLYNHAMTLYGADIGADSTAMLTYLENSLLGHAYSYADFMSLKDSCGCVYVMDANAALQPFLMPLEVVCRDG